MVGIYKITAPSESIYIGKTRNYERRIIMWKYFRSRYQSRMTKSILKYGYDNHLIELINELPYDVDDKILDIYEELYIQQYMSNYNKHPACNGLNLTDGGKGCKGMKMSEQNKAILRERILSGESKLPLLKKGEECFMYGKRGENHPAFGYRHTNEAKLKIGKANSLGKHNLAKKVINIKTGEIYGCIKEAAEKNNIGYSALQAQLTGQNKNVTDLRYYK